MQFRIPDFVASKVLPYWLDLVDKVILGLPEGEMLEGSDYVAYNHVVEAGIRLDGSQTWLEVSLGFYSLVFTIVIGEHGSWLAIDRVRETLK